MTKKTKKKTKPTTEIPRLVALRVRNFMKLEAFDAKFEDGSLILFLADNETGKTSALTAIDVGLRGARSKAMPADPVHGDAKQAEIEIDLGTLLVKRTIKNGRMALDVRPNVKGAVRMTSGQAVLDELIGQFIDPQEVDRLDGAKRAAVLRGLAGLDFTELDASRADYYDHRAEVGRDIKRLTGALAELDEPTGDEGEPQSVTDLLAELKRRREVNDDHAGKRAQLGQMRADAETEIDLGQGLGIRIGQLEADLMAAREQKTASEKTLEDLRGAGKKMAAAVEILQDETTADVEAQIADAEAFAARAADAKRWRGFRQDLDGYEGEHEILTAKIGQVDAAKADAIAKAKYPIPGLEAHDDGVYLDGYPWEQASSARRQSASTAIGFALHPKLKAVLIRDGSLFGAKARAQLLRDAQAAGGQIVMEVVSDDPEIVVRIEDGEVGS